jgi:hypothetical protein
MAVDFSDKTVKEFQSARLKEKAAPKSVNEEVGFLLRTGRRHSPELRRQKGLKLAARAQVGKAFIRWLDKDDVRGQKRFIERLFGLAA